MIYEGLTILASANRNRLKANLSQSCVTIPLLKYGVATVWIRRVELEFRRKSVTLRIEN